MTSYGVVLFPEAEELDLVGPWEVFTASAMLREQEAGESLDSAVTVAATLDPVKCAKGLRILPDCTLDDHPPLDILLVPGGVGVLAMASDSPFNSWLAAQAETATFTTSVCTGSLLLFTSGAASKDTPLATHWSFEDYLEEQGATVEREQRWVQSGSIVSSQGVSAGIDMALWLIGQLHGPDHARATQRYIQYDPAPPYS